MAKKRKNVRSKPNPPSFKQTISRSQQLASDLYRFKVNYAHDSISTKKTLYELRRENANFSMYISAMLDLLVDLTGIPNKTLIEKFMQYCNDKQIVDQVGRVRGNLSVTRYNFS